MARTPNATTWRLRTVEIALRVLLPLAGILLLSAGVVGVLTFGVLPLFERAGAGDWQSVRATVTDHRAVAAARALPLPVDRLELRYRYVIDGQQFEGSNYGAHRGLESRDRSQAFIATVESQPQITVWVDPGDPRRALVRRDLNWRLFAYTIPAMAMVLVGAMLVLTSMLVWNDRRSMFRRG
jgi:hypothetical protein